MKTEKILPVVVGLFACLIALIGICCTTSHSAFKAQVKEPEVKQSAEQDKSLINKISDLPEPEKYCFGGLQFVSEHEGWLSCDKYLWHTLDGGKTWEKAYERRHGTLSYLVNFYFVNFQQGWNYTPNTIEKTEDGGRTWRSVALPIKPDETEILSIKFLPDGKRGWLAGGIFRSYPRDVLEGLDIHELSPDSKKALTAIIFYTEDGGNTWHQQHISAKIGSAVTNLYITSTNQVWAFVGTDLFYLEGSKWKKVDFTKGQYPLQSGLITADPTQTKDDRSGPYAIHFVDDHQGWLSFTNGHIAKTTNGGRTWCDLFDLRTLQSMQGDRIFFTEIYFSDELNGWGLVGGRALYQTKDGGVTWVKADESIKFDTIYFLDHKHGWGVAKAGVFSINP